MLTEDVLKLVDITDTEENVAKIPDGAYCYKIRSVDKNTGRISIDPCPYHYIVDDQEGQDNGYCQYMKHGDWMGDGFSLLWDMVKECDQKEGYENFNDIG